jgi:hypothetical protein
MTQEKLSPSNPEFAHTLCSQGMTQQTKDAKKSNPNTSSDRYTSAQDWPRHPLNSELFARVLTLLELLKVQPTCTQGITPHFPERLIPRT